MSRIRRDASGGLCRWRGTRATSAAFRGATGRERRRGRTSGSRADELEVDIFERGFAAACPAAQFVERACSEELAALNDSDAISETFGDIEDVGREDHRAAAAGALLQQVFDLARHGGVEAS